MPDAQMPSSPRYAWCQIVVLVALLLALSLWGMFRASAGDLHRLTRCLIHLRAASIGLCHHPLVPTDTLFAAYSSPSCQTPHAPAS